MLHRNGGVTRSINTGDHHLHIVVAFVQRRSRDRDFITQLAVFIGDHIATVFMAVDADDNFIARLRIPAHHTRNQGRHAGFGAVYGVVVCHAVEGQGVVRLGVEHHIFMLHRNGGVTRSIDAGDHHLHIVVAFVQRRSRHWHFITQLAVFIGHHIATVFMTVNADDNFIARLRIPTDYTRNQGRHTGFSGIHHVVARHRLDDHMIFGMSVEHHIFMLHHNRGVTRSIDAGDHHLHIVVAFVQRRSRHWHFITQLAVFIGHHIATVFMTVNADDNFIARLRIPTDYTRNQGRHTGFSGIHHVVARHRLDDHMIFGMSVEHHIFMLHHNRGVTRSIDAGDHHLHIVVALEQYRARHRHFVA
ncbi:2-amino-3-ketobutyrate coenzyme A ligase [compost metagenome]